MIFKVKITYYAYDGGFYVYHGEYRPGDDFEPGEDLLQMADNALCCCRADAWRDERLPSEDIAIARVHGYGRNRRVLCEYPCGDEGYREVIHVSTE